MSEHHTQRLRRTMILTPGNQPARLSKACQIDADAVAFDLEDGVSPEHRATANAQLAALDFGHRERLVRINAVGTDDCELDMKSIQFANVDAVFVPKIETPDQLTTLDDVLTGIEMALGRAENSMSSQR